MTPGELIDALRAVVERFPGCVLVKNTVGNLSIMDGEEYVGFVDLGDASWVDLTEDDE
jgi:hypothetical protein